MTLSKKIFSAILIGGLLTMTGQFNEDAEYCRKVYIPRHKGFGIRTLARKFNVN